MMKTGSRFAHILEKGSGKFVSPIVQLHQQQPLKPTMRAAMCV